MTTPTTQAVVACLRRAGMTASKQIAPRWPGMSEGYTCSKSYTHPGLVTVEWRTDRYGDGITHDAGLAQCLTILHDVGMNARIVPYVLHAVHAPMSCREIEVRPDDYPWPTTAMDAPAFARHVALTAAQRKVEEAKGNAETAYLAFKEASRKSDDADHELHLACAELARLEGETT